MKNVVKEYIQAKKILLRYFECPTEYFIRYMEGYNWHINGEDGVYFLSYWQDSGGKETNMAVSKNDGPLVYYAGDYALVIAVDCVKTGFILEAAREVKTGR